MTRDNNPMFFKLWDLKCVKNYNKESSSIKCWNDYNIYATTTKDLEMSEWNGRQPVEKNLKNYICKSGSKVNVFMVSRFGDVGVTDKLKNPTGYNVRGLDADIDLKDYEFIELNK